ncbi:MAG: hypothetical protein AB7S26_23365 [Sandaracinaceae bacterium]
MRTPLLALSLALGVTGCFTARPLAIVGDQCTINSDCQDPLVCALGRCRVECTSGRDCALGLRCMKLPDVVGVCQLPDEAMCSLASDCTAPLVCFMPGGCLPECEEDIDCSLGETCQETQCFEREVPFCVYHSDCPYPDICDREQCRRECTTQVDCDPGEECVQFETCNGPCMCRIACELGVDSCPDGTDCIPCVGDCGTATAYCERPTE